MAISHILRQHQISYVRIAHTSELRMACPSCSKYREKSDIPCLSIYPNKKWHCHHCQEHGSEKELLKLLEIHDIYNNGEIMPAAISTKKAKYITSLPAEALPAHKNKLARSYLASRNLSIEDMKKFAFLYCKDGFYADRVIAPIFDRKGEYRTFASRSIHGSVAKKYLYPKGTSISQLLYNLHFVKQTNKIMIVEGIFDALHCFPHAVASFGKHISDRQISSLRMHGMNTVYLVWDAEAWQETPDLWARAVQKLSEHFFTFPIKLAQDTPTEYKLSELKDMCRITL